MVAYTDFQNKAPTDECLDPENKKMFVVLYVTIFAFHPDLDIDRVIIKCSFCHSREKLPSFNYLKHKQLDFKDNKTLLQLRDSSLLSRTKRSKLQFLKCLAPS